LASDAANQKTTIGELKKAMRVLTAQLSLVESSAQTASINR